MAVYVTRRHNDCLTIKQNSQQVVLTQDDEITVLEMILRDCPTDTLQLMLEELLSEGETNEYHNH